MKQAFQESFDCVIVGAGLSGLMVANRMNTFGITTCIVNAAYDESNLGGLADQFGNKLSLPPAGMGLSKLAGGKNGLVQLTVDILKELNLLNKVPNSWYDEIRFDDELVDNGFKLRKYFSIMLTRSEMQDLIRRLLPNNNNYIKFLRGTCVSVTKENNAFCSFINSNDFGEIKLTSKTIVIAAGRSGSNIKLPIQAILNGGKGIDLGVRLEFAKFSAFSNLLKMSRDAKILKDGIRTFCINAPGKIEHYEINNILIAGGAIVESGEQGNFGILVRCNDKQQKLERLEAIFKNINKSELVAGFDLSKMYEQAIKLYGEDVVDKIKDFINSLANQNVIDISKLTKAYVPLIDWFWPIYCKADSLETSLPNFWVTGDLAGHARGLMQALISGWLVSEKIIKTNKNVNN